MITQVPRRRWPWVIVVTIANVALLPIGAIMITILMAFITRTTQQALLPLLFLVALEIFIAMLLLCTKRHVWLGQTFLLSLLLGIILSVMYLAILFTTS